MKTIIGYLLGYFFFFVFLYSLGAIITGGIISVCLFGSNVPSEKVNLAAFLWPRTWYRFIIGRNFEGKK